LPQSATRFRAGIAAPCGLLGANVGNNIDDIQPGGGPTSGFLYDRLQNLNGLNLFSDSTVDLYMMVALDKGKSIAAGETLKYGLVFVSDTVDENTFKAKVDAGAGLLAALDLCSGCACDCHGDPGGNCDGVTTVLDVVSSVNVAFRNFADIPDPNGACPYVTTDVNCDNFTTVIDVVKFVNVAFRNANPLTEFCDPCP
jgi:hypothetical protein